MKNQRSNSDPIEYLHSLIIADTYKPKLESILGLLQNA